MVGRIKLAQPRDLARRTHSLAVTVNPQADQQLRIQRRPSGFAFHQPALFKKPLKHSQSVVFSGGGKRFTSEQKTAGMISDRQRVAVFVIAEQELPFVLSAPQLVGALAQGESGPVRAPTHAAAALDQAMAVQHRMDGALGGNRHPRKSTQQALADLAGTPAAMLVLYVQDEVLDL